MSDPLAEIVQLLRPRAVFSKRISGAGAWAVSYPDFGKPGFSVVLEGRCILTVRDRPSLTLEAGDFVLMPSTPAFVLSGVEPAEPVLMSLEDPPGREAMHHSADVPPDVRLLGGNFTFESTDSQLLSSLLPDVLHVRDIDRLSTLVQLLSDEAEAERPGRDLVLSRFVEIMLLEALRSSPGAETPPGLLRGLTDPDLTPTIQRMHENIAHPWTVKRLAQAASLSRSTLYDRFTATVGIPPMEYLRTWRMAVAKDLLRHQNRPLSEVAALTGYGSASAFSTAFSRHVGSSPSRFARTG